MTNAVTNNSGQTINIRAMLADTVGEVEASTILRTKLGWVMGGKAASLVTTAARAYGLKVTEVGGALRFSAAG